MERHFQVHGNGQAADILSKEKDWNKIYTFHWMSYNDKQVAGEKTKSVTSRKRATKARTGRWGFCAVFKHFSRFEFFLLSSRVHPHPNF